MNFRRIGGLFSSFRRLRELEIQIKRGELVPVRNCRECARGYTYCIPFDRWHPDECPRRSEPIWKE